MKRRPARWIMASHGVRCEFEVTPDVFMLHLKFADSDLLRERARRRHQLHLADGRGGGSWQRSWVHKRFRNRMEETDFATLPEFDPTELDVASLRQRTKNGKGWRTRTDDNAQLQALRDEPIVGIPHRLRGQF